MSRVEQALRRAHITSQDTFVIVDNDAPEPPVARDDTLLEPPGRLLEELDLPLNEPGLAGSIDLTACEKLVVSAGFDPVAAEQYRKLAAALHQMQIERGTRSVMVSSTLPREGKTLTAANLAVTLSESFQRRVLLIDADMRRPSAHDIFKVPNATGLSNELAAGHGIIQSLVQLSPRLTLLPGGPPNSDPMSGLTSTRMQHLVEDAVGRFDWVVLDAPPILALPDASLLARILDVIVFVVRAGKTPNRSIQQAMGLIDRTKVAGVVLNRVVGASAAYGYAYDAADGA